MFSQFHSWKTGVARIGNARLTLAFVVCALSASAQITISGVTDKSTYTDTASFTVVTQAGYSYCATLNNNPVPVGATVRTDRMDYYDLWAWRTNLSAPFDVASNLVRFIVIASDRGAPEKGLIKWTPYPPINSSAEEFAGAHLRLILPQDYPPGLPIPVVAWVENDQDDAIRVNGYLSAAGFEGQNVQVVRGVGSGFLSPATNAGTLSYAARIETLTAPRQIRIDPNPTWTTVGAGVLSGSITWPENSRIYISGSVVIPAGSALQIGAGTIVKLNPLVNITNNGTVRINGTADRPVVFTATNVVSPEKNAGAWGGFVMRLGNAVFEANHAILAGGGGGTGWSFSPGSSHKSQQPVLFIWSNSVARLTNCAILNSAGQMGNGYNSDLTLDHTLWQRAITGGEYVGGTIIVNHSAILEFPAIDGVYDATIADADYDGIYFTEGTHILMNSLFGFAKDDAIDSGSGSAGTVWVTNCWVESALHEAHAWSGGGRVAKSYDTVLINSGQGIECGWSTGSGSPDCFADRLLTTGNSVGARVGDNYDSSSWSYLGFLRLTNSLILNNYRDIFLKTWPPAKSSGPDTNSWVDRVLQVDFRDNLVTTAEDRFPGNLPWNPASDGWQLAHWMTTPPDAPVGIGLALWTNRLTAADLTNGVPVRLSSFTTNTVSVDYTVMGTNGQVAAGTLQFAPGETVKTLPALWPSTNQPLLAVTLKNPTRGQITSLAQAWYVAPPRPASAARCSSPGARGGPTSTPEATRVRPGATWVMMTVDGQMAWHNSVLGTVLWTK